MIRSILVSVGIGLPIFALIYSLGSSVEAAIIGFIGGAFAVIYGRPPQLPANNAILAELCPHCKQPWPETETILPSGELGCKCQAQLA